MDKFVWMDSVLKSTIHDIPYAYGQTPDFSDKTGFVYVTDTIEINHLNVSGGLSDSDAFGRSVTSAGDLDGDGVPDIIVGANQPNVNRNEASGDVYVVFMNSDGTVRNARIMEQLSTNTHTVNAIHRGTSVASLGDLNGDDIPDIAIGASGDINTTDDHGAIYILLMNRDGTTDRIIPITHNTPNGPTLDTGDFFGNSIALVDDLDGNNVPDIAVGAIGDDAGGDSRGAIHILLMNSDHTIRNTIEINSTTPRGPILNDKGFFGQSVASTDLNNDGTPDIIAGTYLDSNNGYSRGAVHIMFMNSDGTIQNTVRIDESTTNGPRLSNEAHFGVSVASAGDLDNDGVDDVLVGSYENRSNTGSVYIMLMNPDGSIKSTSKINSSTSGGPVLSAGDRLGVSVTPIGDLNGDGMPDIVAGAYWDDAGGTNRGAVHLMLLDPIRPVPNYKVHDTAKITTQAVQGSGYSNQFHFGTVSSIGDIDSDGTPDIAVGARGDVEGGANRGAVYILLMNNDGTVKSATAINDATPRGPTLANHDLFGTSVTSIGDIDEDGTPDIAVGADGDDSVGVDRGAVYILLMNNDGTVKNTVKINDATPRGPTLSNGDGFGTSVTSIGDIDEDGTPDIAVGADDDNGSGGSLRGAVHILFMSNDGTVKRTVEINSATPRGPTLSNSDTFGASIASIGDINGDGTPDIAVGADGDNSNRGAVHILFMNNDGTVKSTVEINSTTPRGPTLSLGDRFGASIASIGDINGDGTPDIAVGARDDSKIKAQQGAFYILLLNDDGAVKRSVKIDSNTTNIPDMSIGDRFGSSIASVGDINGDGTPDIAVGADQDDSGGSNRGAVYIIFLDKTVVIQGVTSSADDGRHTQGPIDIDVLFSEPVGVVGSPYLTLETGRIDRNAVYVSGNNTTVLTFRYTIQKQDTTLDLNYLSKSSLSLNNSKIFASQSPHDPAVLELPIPSLQIEVNPSGIYGPLALNKEIQIEAQLPPDKPTNLIANPLNKQVILNWSAPTYVSPPVIDYTVQYRVNDGVTHAWETFPDTFLNTTGIVTGLTNGVQYQFRVNATNAVGTGPASDVVPATPRTVPEAPSNLTADPGNEQVDLSWTAPHDGGSPITGYIVEYTSNNGASWSEFADITDTYANVTGLTNGQQYHFRVNATNAVGTGPASDIVPATPVTLPGAPENLIATVNGTTIELTWDPPANDGGATITSYTVQQSTDGITWDTVPDLNSADTKATTPNVLLNTKYSFRVNATNAVGTGPASDIVMSLIDTKPSVRLSTNITGPTSLDSIPFTISVNERVTGLEASEISTSSGIVKNLVLGNYTFGGAGNGTSEFSSPLGIATNGTGYVYVADTFNHRVQIFDAAGAYLGEFGRQGSSDGEFSIPFGIAINGTGHVYVTDSGNRRVQIFDAVGTYLGEFGRQGSGNGEFVSPYGIAINGTGHVYVTDNFNHRVQIFDAVGAYLGEFGSGGSGNSEFSRPNGIAINGTGYVYVTDSGNHRVQIFDAAGAYLGEFGRHGSDNSEFRNPNGIAINDAGHVYVADTVNDRVQIFDTAGMYLDKIVSSDLTLDLDNPIAVAIRGTSLYIIDSDTSHVHVLRNFYTFEVHNPSVGTLQVHIPADVVQDDAGNNNTASNIIRISIVTVPGVPQNLVATPGDATVTLAWDQPRNDGGAAIISYIVQQSIDGVIWTLVPDSDNSDTTATAIELTNDSQYQFRVNATNIAGTGPASIISATPTDTTLPSVTINDVTMEATGVTTSVDIGYPEITDASGGPYTVTYNATGNVQTTSGASNVTVSLGVGMIIVQWNVTDPSNNIGTALQMVDVTDTTPPTITLIGSASVTVTLGGTYEEQGAVCSDIVDADKSATVGGDTVNTDSTGQYTVQYTCTDTAGNEATPVDRTVTVHDPTAPSISINDITMEATGATTSVDIGYPEITDASGGPYTVTYNATGSVQTTSGTSNVTVSLGVGRIIVQWSVTDPSDNTGTTLQMVDVTDTTPPTITLSGSASVTVTLGDTYEEDGAVCSDIVDADKSATVGGDTVNTDSTGQYTVQYTCTDTAGNEATPVDRTVTVHDPTSPSISINDVTMEATGVTTSVDIGYPEITDASGGPYTVTYNATGSVQTTSGTSNVTVSLGVGRIIVQWSVTDPSNNMGTALQMVDVTDTTPPTITLTGSASVTVTLGGTYEEDGAVCSDIVDADKSATVGGDTVNTDSTGQYTVQYTCTDTAGNEATPVDRTVTVHDPTVPSVVIDDVTMEATGATTSVDIGYPEITDASGGPYTVTYNATGNVQTTSGTSNVTVSLGVGMIIVQWSVTDPSNNMGTALQMVDVTDTTPPTITLTGSASVTVTLGDTYEEEGAVCSDIVDADKSATVGGDTVNTDSTGQYTVQYTCTDTAGNEATPVDRTVTVHDPTVPSVVIDDVTMEATGATTSVDIGYPEITDASGGPYTVTYNATGNVQTTSGTSNVTVSLGVGRIIVQWSVTDPSNNIGTALQMVDVTDTTPPTITLTGSASVTVTLGGTYEEDGAICSDIVDADKSATVGGDTVNTDSTGQYTVQYTCTDTAGNEATPVDRTVIVHMASDTTSPSISINDVTMEATGATTSVDIGYPEITDASGGPYTVTYNATGNVQTTSGTSNVTVSLGVGRIIVQWNVTDPSNNMGTALQMVDVTDTTPPTITLIGSASVTVTLGSTYEEQGAVCTDLVDGNIVPVQLGTVDAFTLGQYTIQYTCTDTAGNEATPVDRTVIVHMASDTTSPSISIDDVTMEATGATTSVDIGYPEITDASGGPYTITYNATGNVQTTSGTSNVTVSLGVGRIIVQWNVTDPSNNMGTALQMVDVTDTTPPTITLTGSSSVTITIGNSYVDAGAVCTDLVDGNIVPVQLGTVDAFTLGQYTIQYTCTDAAGNEATPISRTVTVHMASDTTSPSISINDVTMEATGATTSVDIGYPEITDASGGPYTVTYNATGNVQTTSGTSNVTVSLGVGRIIVQWNVTDPSNNMGTALQMVDVTDTTPPTITLTGSSSVTITIGNSYVDAGAVCTDLVDGNIVPVQLGTVDAFTLGQYTIQYTCTDTAGNEATPISRTVTVHMASDTTSPSISINDVTMEATGATTSVDIGYPEITDASGGPYTVTYNATGNVQTTSGTSNVTVSLGVGRIIVQWNVTDPSNNMGTALQMVDVTDTTPPTITLIGSASVTVTLGSTYEEQGAVCTDLVDGNIVPVQLGTVDAFTLGQYTIQYTCTDAAGNEATPVDRTVIVHMASDTTSPSISINDVTMEATGATTSVDIGYPEITDASGGPYTVTYNATGNVQTTSGTSNVTVSLGVGRIIVQWNVTDPSNNIGTALQMVDVTDTTPPTITLIGSASVTVTLGSTYEEQGAVCTDLVDGNIVPVQLGTVDAFTLGQYTIQYTCTDAAGNEATPVDRTVIVHMASDTTSPSISIDDVTMEATGATTSVDIGYPEITDASGGPYTVTYNATGNVQTTSGTSNVTVSLGVGRIIVQWNVTDPSNNIGTALQMVDVTDTTPPTITLIGSASVTVTLGSTYEEQGAVCTDLVDGNIVPVQLGTVDAFTLGQYTIQYTCTDAAGNEATPVDRTVIVHMASDTTSPSISIDDVTMEATGATTSVDIGYPEITDASGGPYTVTYNATGNVQTTSGTSNVTVSLGVGRIIVQWNVTDPSNNIGTALQMVDVTDTTPPTITLIGSASVTVTLGSTYEEQGAVCTDLVDGNIVPVQLGTVDAFTLGQYTIQYTCTDAAGNEATPISRTVTVHMASDTTSLSNYSQCR